MIDQQRRLAFRNRGRYVSGQEHGRVSAVPQSSVPGLAAVSLALALLLVMVGLGRADSPPSMGELDLALNRLDNIIEKIETDVLDRSPSLAIIDHGLSDEEVCGDLAETGDERGADTADACID